MQLFPFKYKVCCLLQTPAFPPFSEYESEFKVFSSIQLSAGRVLAPKPDVRETPV